MNIKNPIFKFIFNNFDFPIRYLYSRLSPLGLFQRLFKKIYTSNPSSLFAHFELMMGMLEANNISLENKTVLELGPGTSFLTALQFLDRGVRQVFLVDKFPRISKDEIISNLTKDIEVFESLKNRKTEITLDANKIIQDQRIQMLSGDLVDLNFQKNFDFVYSKSVFEHIKNVEQVIKKCYQILSCDGYMFHYIDFKDHYNFASPFLFYKYSDRVWEKYLTKQGYTYTNRLRIDDFLKLFDELNFQVLDSSIEKKALHETKISEKFSKKEKSNLETTSVRILLKKSC